MIAFVRLDRLPEFRNREGITESGESGVGSVLISRHWFDALIHVQLLLLLPSTHPSGP
jgi:hypothetical protein